MESTFQIGYVVAQRAGENSFLAPCIWAQVLKGPGVHQFEPDGCYIFAPVCAYPDSR